MMKARAFHPLVGMRSSGRVGHDGLGASADAESAVAAPVALAEHGVQAEAGTGVHHVGAADLGVAVVVGHHVVLGGVVVTELVQRFALVVEVVVVERAAQEFALPVGQRLSLVRVEPVELAATDAPAGQRQRVDVERAAEVELVVLERVEGVEVVDQRRVVEGVPAGGALDERVTRVVPAVVERGAELHGLVAALELQVTPARRELLGRLRLGGGASHLILLLSDGWIAYFHYSIINIKCQYIEIYFLSKYPASAGYFIVRQCGCN